MMNLFERIVVGVADAESDAALMRYAREVARLRRGAVCQFVHVAGWSTRAAFRDEPVTHNQILRRLQNKVLQEFGTDSGAVCRVVHGNVVDRLLECAAETAADLILVGHRENQSGRRAMARRLAMQAPCSVWMLPQGAPERIRNVLAALDYSEPSAQALGVASHIARRTGSSRCLALHVYFNEAVAASAEYETPVLEQEREAFERFTAPLDVHGATLVPVFDESSNVAHSIQRVVAQNQVDLVVMGSRGQSRSASILLGSESENVLMESKTPVLIVKRRGERIGLLQALLDRDFHLQEPPRFG